MRSSLCRWVVAIALLLGLAPAGMGQEAAAPPSATPATDLTQNDSASELARWFLFPQAGQSQANDQSQQLKYIYDRQVGQGLTINLEDHLIAANPLGIEVAPVEAPLRAQLKLPGNEGLIVLKAPPESDGAKAGLQQHDVILRVVDQPVAEVPVFVELLKAQPEEKPLQLVVVRQGKPIDVQAVIRPTRVVNLNYDDLVRLRLTNPQVESDRYMIGVTLADVDETLRSQLKLPEGHGLVVTEVIENSAAAEAGIQANDILTALDGQPLTTIEKINEQVQTIGGRQVTLDLLRAGGALQIAVTPRMQTNVAQAAGAFTFLYGIQGQNCQSCHQNPHGGQAAFHSNWTANNYSLYLNALGAAHEAAGDVGEKLTKLKSQLTEMQATLAALEAELAEKEAPKKD